MIEYRPFRNTDPPALCDIWRHHAPLRARFQPLTPHLLEATVLSKPYFDRRGLIVAFEAGVPIGFVHAGFGSQPEGCALDRSVGAVCMLMVANTPQRDDVAKALLERGEQYLREGGAQVIYGGGSRQVAPFYLGLYGGASLPGVLNSDAFLLQIFGQAGYVVDSTTRILQRTLAGFRPLVDRQQIQLKRTMQIDFTPDPSSSCWWEACEVGQSERFAYCVRSRAGGASLGTVIFWDVEPLGSSWGVHARGLCSLHVPPSEEQDAISLFLLGESLRLMATGGATLAEVHLDSNDQRLAAVLLKLGFQEIEHAVQLKKT